MNSVAKLFESSASRALDDPDIANKLGKAYAHTIVSMMETMGALQSHNPKT